MKFSIFSTALLAVGVIADASTVKADIKGIAAQLAILKRDVGRVVAGAGGFAFALAVQSDAVLTKSLVDGATNDVNASPKFNGSDSLSIGVQLLSLKGTVVNTLQAVGNQSSAFGGLDPVVLYSLYDLKKSTDKFGAAIQTKLSALEAAIAPSVIKSIDAAFQSAIQAYGG